MNEDRRRKAPGGRLKGESYDACALKAHPELGLAYIVAPPRMALYIEYSTRIYDIYLKYIAPEDIHVYSIDEVFMDITGYLNTYHLTAYELAMRIIRDILHSAGITATVGIGTNMYLAKIAMDIKAKKMLPDKDGVRIAELDEMSYRRELWAHTPLTDFWRVGRGTANKLEANGLYTMGDIARYSLSNFGEEKLYQLFGVNAELLIDHAWGWEPCTIMDVKAYEPENKSIGSGQVLHCPYDFNKAKLIVREMTELLALDLVEKRLVTDQVVLTVGYDIENLKNPEIKKQYKGGVVTDQYGRRVPKHAHGTANIGRWTSSANLIMKAVVDLYEKIVNPKLLVRRVNLSANHVVPEKGVEEKQDFEQLDLFTDYEALQKKREQEELGLKKERAIQEATIELRNKFGKNAILKGTNLQEGATTKDRNRHIGGHKA